jgi:hypothetical protein
MKIEDFVERASNSDGFPSSGGSNTTSEGRMRWAA